jgi:hypothetical protein
MNDPHEEDRLPQVYQQRSLVARGVDRIVGLYDPKPMVKPEVDENIDKMGVLEQVVETFSYNTSSFLYAISPEGGLQAWWKMMTRLTLFCLPIGIFFMLAEPVTKVIQHTMESIGLTVLYAVTIAFFISAVVIFVKSKAFSLLGLIFGTVFSASLVAAFQYIFSRFPH